MHNISSKVEILLNSFVIDDKNSLELGDSLSFSKLSVRLCIPCVGWMRCILWEDTGLQMGLKEAQPQAHLVTGAAVVWILL